MLSMYGMNQKELDDLRLNMCDDFKDRGGLPCLDSLYVKWNEEDQSLAGILTNKQTKQKNFDFRLKLESWKQNSRKMERKAMKKRNFEQGKVLRDFFQSELENFK